MLAKPQSILQTAIACHRSGNLEQADAIYAQIVARDPSNAEAVHLRGVVAYQKGDYASAAGTIERALSVRPDNSACLNDLGLAYQALGRLAEAAASYQAALNPAPRFAQPIDTASIDRWRCAEPLLRQPIYALSIDWWQPIEPPRRQPIDTTSTDRWKHIEPLPRVPPPESGGEAIGGRATLPECGDARETSDDSRQSWVAGQPAGVEDLPADLGAADTEIITASNSPYEWRVQLGP
jgi:tetratricopeptide (TPR) repeat protein